MQHEGFSRTAYLVALRRAAHQSLDSPKIFDDPLACRILDPIDDPRRKNFARRADTRRRAFMAVRSRYAEDQLARATARGVRQYVILGAGLDTYAYRSQSGVRVFEVDHHSTQSWKRRLLHQSGIAIPDAVTFVPADFEREPLDQTLLANGFRLDQPAFFAWLGVTMYLTRESAVGTFRFIASMPAGSGVAFDYVLDPAELSPGLRFRQHLIARAVAGLGEPFRLYFRPSDLAQLLKELGFSAVEDLGPAEIDERYFAGRNDGLRVSPGWGHLCSAWVILDR
ncbi:MAG TPA: class I SAM-dependent methyltransferase [Bryobacteraceae bacterium]|nr:class I SAM-dependent methyltransferase [Bryobacteraceae bacterium]